MHLAVLGAGAIGPAAAAIAVSRGHSAAIWSPSGRGTAGMDGVITAEGVLEGVFPVDVAGSLEAVFAGADAALLAVPAYALAEVLPRIARALPPGLPLMISPAASLAPLVLDALWAQAGAPARRAPIGALATTPCGARRLGPTRVRVGMRRSTVEMAAVPSAAAAEMGALAAVLFGMACPVSADALHVSLLNLNPIAHAVLALCNVTRMEHGEAWPQYAMMTPAACRLMEMMAAERQALAGAYGHRLDSLGSFLQRANGVAMAPLAEMTAAIAAARPDVLGPKTLETRYVTEDVPFGLAYYLAIAAPKGIAMPATEAVIRLLELLWGREWRANPMLAALDLPGLPQTLAAGVGRG